VRAIEHVAEKLGNTPSVCRKCYVHPAVVDAYLDGSMLEGLLARTEQELADDLRDLQPEEAAVLGMLQARLAREAVQLHDAPAPAARRRSKPSPSQPAR
jgi:DNA topoisomerase-1